MIYNTETKRIKSFKDDIKSDLDIMNYISYFNIFETYHRDDTRRILLMFKNNKKNKDLEFKDRRLITYNLDFFLREKLDDEINQYIQFEIDDYMNIFIYLNENERVSYTNE